MRRLLLKTGGNLRSRKMHVPCRERTLMSETSTVTIGCDLGDRVSTLCILGSDGALERPKPIKTTREAFSAFFTRSAAHVILEVGTHSRWVSQLLEQLGHRVTVANPRRLKLISTNDSKNDRKDAELLARLGRADEQLLAPVKHRGTQVQADLAVAKSTRGVLCFIRSFQAAASIPALASSAPAWGS
jgi:hypothetical protein